MLEVTCATCGKTFLKRPCWAKRTTQHFCSRQCNGKERAKALLPHAGNWRGKTRPGKYGPDNPAWKGGVTYWRKHGNYKPVKYVRCPAEYLPMARKDGYVMEHRLLVAQSLGRCLSQTEVVHHRDHDPQNNDLANLELFPTNRAHKLAESAQSVAAS